MTPTRPPDREGGAPVTSRAEEWRLQYLTAMAVLLALIEYVDRPDATLDGVRDILTRRETGVI